MRMIFPSKEDVLEIALKLISKNITIIKITDNKKDLQNLYGFDPGCWYIVYKPKFTEPLCSYSFIAISKVDGRIINQGIINDEG
jgi:hypothetical protein